MIFFHFVVTLLFQAASLVSAADTAAWKSRSIYFVLTDRIARNSDDTGGSACGNLGDYCGGTFKGLESKLDYISGAGFDAVWITPVVANSAGGYHGYWAQDLYSVNAYLGTADDIKSLVSTAHSKGMYVMVDVVANHMGNGPISDDRPEPLDQQSSYHTACPIDYSNQTSIENCELADLPDVDTQDPNIRSLYQTWIKWLVNEYSFDGVRIDTVKHVEKEFWTPFTQAAGVYTIGEVFDGSPSYVAGYANTMAGLLNYPVYYPLNRFYQQQGSSQDLVDMINTVSSSFPDPAALGTFIDNHDNPRWLNQKNDQALLKNALAFVILSRGIPIVYYGTEQGYSGGADPANREDLWRSNFNTQTDLYQAIAKLNSARKAAGGLAGDDHVHLYVTSQAYAWSRANGNLVVLTTNGGGSYNAQHCFNTQKTNGQWTNTYGDGSTVTADGNGQVCVQVTNGEPVILVAGGGVSSRSATRTTMHTIATACPTSVSVTFTQKVTTAIGDTIRITGNTTQLGNWTPSSGPALSASSYTSSNPIWTISLPLTPGSGIQYKFVKVASGGTVTWESDPNRVYSVPRCQDKASVTSSWQ